MFTNPFLRAITIVQILALVSCIRAHGENPEEQPSSPAPHEVSIPTSLKKYLTKKLPDYRLVSKKDYEPYWFDPANKQYLVDFNWSIRADFDGNGNDDYALLMIGKVDGERLEALVAVRRLNDGWAHDILSSYSSKPPITEKIYIDTPGEKAMGLADEENPEMKMLSFPSIIAEALESCGTTRYYWENGAWREIYIGL